MSSADRGWTDVDVPPQEGKRFVITGANSGLGFEMARVLSARGAEVVLACRDRGRGEAALAALRQEGAGDRVSLELLDLASLDSVRAFAERECESPRPLDVLVANAGLMAIPERKTADGFEMTMGVNHLGHFALAARLFDKLATTDGARLVTISSQVHRAASLGLLDDIFLEKRGYQRWVAYQQSKLANLLFHYELTRRIARADVAVRSLAAHPGYAASELHTQGAKLGGSRLETWMLSIGQAAMAQSGQAGTWPQLRAATDPTAQNGDYFGPRSIGQLRGPAVRVESAASARNEAAAAKLWAMSETLTRVSFVVRSSRSTR